MRALLLATAASLATITFSATPAAAEGGNGPGFSVHSGGPSSVNDVRFGSRDGDRRDRRRHGDGDVFIGNWPQQGDTAWRSNSFNDWWHDQPNRAYPAWVQRNQDCQRMWWSGGGWRC